MTTRNFIEEIIASASRQAPWTVHTPVGGLSNMVWIERGQFERILRTELQSFARKVVGEIARVKDTVASSQGSGKYDSCYDDCIYIVSSLSGLSGEDNSPQQ